MTLSQYWFETRSICRSLNYDDSRLESGSLKGPFQRVWSCTSNNTIDGRKRDSEMSKGVRMLNRRTIISSLSPYRAWALGCHTAKRRRCYTPTGACIASVELTVTHCIVAPTVGPSSSYRAMN